MFKALVALFVASSFVCFSGLEEFDPKGMTPDTFLGADTRDGYSFIDRDVDGGKADGLKSVFDELGRGGAPLPLLMKKSTVGGRLRVRILNVYRMDLQIYPNVFLLIKSLEELIKSLVAVNKLYKLGLSHESFAYQPSTRSFVFIDFDKLQNLDPTATDETDLRKSMASRLFSSFSQDNIPLTPTDLKYFNDLGINVREFNEKFIFKSIQKEKKFIEISSFKFEGNTNNYLVFENSSSKYSSKSEYSGCFVDKSRSIPPGERNRASYYIQLNKYTNPSYFEYFNCKQQPFSSETDKFFLYLCRANKDGDTECSNIPGSLFKKEFPIPKDLSYLEAEIRHFKFDKDGSPANFFEIFFTLRPIESKKLLTSAFIETSPVPDTEKEEVYFACQTSDGKVTLGSSSQEPSKYPTFQLTSGKWAQGSSQSGFAIFQISPSLVEKQAKACVGPEKRMFYFKRDDKTLVIFLDQKQEMIGLGYKQNDRKADPLTLEVCRKAVPDLLLDIEDRRFLMKAKVEKRYPKDLAFALEKPDSKRVDKFCVEVFQNGGYNLRLELGDLPEKFFFFNFNLQDDTTSGIPNESVVILSDSKKQMHDFWYGNFKYPETKLFVIFISVAKSASANGFDIRVIYTQDNVKFFELSADKAFVASQPPEKFFHSAVDKGAARDLEDDIKTVYLSDTEVVYQLKVLDFGSFDNFDNKILFDDKNKSLTITAGPKGFFGGTSAKSISKEKINTQGLKKVFSQVFLKNRNRRLVLI